MTATGAAGRAQSLVRILGGDAVTLRFAAPPAGGDGEELGLASPEFHDVVLRPAHLRVQQGRVTVLVDARTAEDALATEDARRTLLAAAAVVVHGETLRVEAVERRSVFGRAYLYRLLLAAAGEKAR